MTLRRTLPASFGLEQAKAHLEAVIEFNDFAFIDRLRGRWLPGHGLGSERTFVPPRMALPAPEQPKGPLTTSWAW